jgi:DNA repair protein RadD
MPRSAAPHEARAGTAGVLSGQVSEDTYTVEDVRYFVHAKRGALPETPKTMRVEYRLGFNHYQSEWICFEHTGYARHKAELWWRRRSHAPVPATAVEAVALAESGALTPTRAITVRYVSGEEFSRVVDYDLGDLPAQAGKPAWVSPGTEVGAEIGAGRPACRSLGAGRSEPDYAPADDSILF